MAFTIEPDKVMPETDETELAWLQLYSWMASYGKNGLIVKATPENLKIALAQVRLDKKPLTKKARG